MTIVGVDDSGESPGSEVSLSLDGYASRTLSAADLESGAEGLSGSLGDGTGKWRLEIRGGVYAQSLMESPTGHLTNLSASDHNGGEVALFRSAGHPTQQSFARVINWSDAPIRVEFAAFDDDGTELGTFPVSVPASGGRHFNSDDAAMWLGLSGDSGDLRLRVVGFYERYGDGELEVLNYMRTKDGFLTGLNDTPDPLSWTGGPKNSRGYEHEGSQYHYLPFLNPGANRRQRSQLRIVNHADYDWGTANLSIVAVDHEGVSRGGVVRMTLPAGTSRTLTSEDLESGGSGFDGYLGSGKGKWRLYVFPDDGAWVTVMSLLESPTGHLTNLTATSSPYTYSTKPVPPPTIPDPQLRAVVAEALGKPADAAVTRSDMADLTELEVPKGADVHSLMGLQLAVNLRRLTVGRDVDGSMPLWGLRELRRLDMQTVTDLSQISPLPNLVALNCDCVLSQPEQELTAFRGLPMLESLQGIELALSADRVDLRPLTALEGLKSLTIQRTVPEDASRDRPSDLPPLPDLSPLAELKGLENLQLLFLNRRLNYHIRRFFSPADIADLSPLAALENLRSLTLELDTRSIPVRGTPPDMSALSRLRKLESLTVRWPSMHSLEFIRDLTSLIHLDVANGTVSDLAPLAGLRRLQSLYLHNNNVADLSALGNLTEMRRLSLRRNRIADLTPIAAMVALEWLDISNNNIADLSALGSLTEMTYLSAGANYVVDLTPISSLPKLSHLALPGNEIASLEPLVGGFPALVELDLAHNDVTDPSPLLERSSLESLTGVNLAFNPLNDEALTNVIPQLVERLGGRIAYDDVDYFRPQEALVFETYADNLLVVRDMHAGCVKRDDSTQSSYDIRCVLSELYRHFPDEFDFVVAVLDAEGGIAGKYIRISQELATGIGFTAGGSGGKTSIANLESEGSPRIKAWISLDWSLGVDDPTLSHEIMHAWGNRSVLPSADVIPHPEGHWGGTSFVGALGGFGDDIKPLIPLGGNEYGVSLSVLSARRSHTSVTGYTSGVPYAPFEMYLAGFYAPEEVPEFWIAPDSKWVLDENLDIRVHYEDTDRYLVVELGERHTVRIDDVIAAFGPRFPDSSAAQRHFRAVAVVLPVALEKAQSEGIEESEYLQQVSRFLDDYSHQSLVDPSENALNFYTWTHGRASIAFDGLSLLRKPSASDAPPRLRRLLERASSNPVFYCVAPHPGHPLGWSHLPRTATERRAAHREFVDAD
ncbi:MAG: leucine-rich repeat domain-containing protein [Gammaproteobacteria bacterium]|nr:leucine-rich repeat domain-containing protein [Gammaproteobacteria bacterium]MDE0272796.1 leucine-rich repeat domain-containing protein [Gammaproteobacteria bacterium]